MTKLVIKIKDCDPDVNNGHVSASQKDEIEWKNQNTFDVTIDFDQLPSPIFEGYGNKPKFVVPAKGPVTVRLRDDAPTGPHGYDIISPDCDEDERVGPDTIIVDP
jgi:hypothetical protein